MKKNVTGNLLVCTQCDPPWVGTVAEGFKWSVLDDCCPQCGNSDLEDHLTELEPEEYRELLTQSSEGGPGKFA